VLINSYEVEEAPNGAWWVRRPDRPQHAWRFATLAEALRFARALHPPRPPARPTPFRRPGDQPGQGRRGA
jgi:hypothetical protein